MATHTTLSGHVIQYDPSPAVAAFLARLEKLVADPAASENDAIALAYGPDNPLLQRSPGLPGLGTVTAEVLADPAYRVLTDLLHRKHVAERKVDVDQLAARYTLSVSDAAERLGVHRSAVQQAIDAGRLGSWMKNGRHHIDPQALASFKLAPRGPKPRDGQPRASTDPLEIVAGTDGDMTLHVKHGLPLDDATTARAGKVVRATLSPWRRVGVFSGSRGRARFAVLEPGAKENEIKFGNLSVKGRFEIVERVNNAKRASEAFKAFQPA